MRESVIMGQIALPLVHLEPLLHACSHFIQFSPLMQLWILCSSHTG